MEEEERTILASTDWVSHGVGRTCAQCKSVCNHDRAWFAAAARTLHALARARARGMRRDCEHAGAWTKLERARR